MKLTFFGWVVIAATVLMFVASPFATILALLMLTTIAFLLSRIFTRSTVIDFLKRTFTRPTDVDEFLKRVKESQ